MARVYLDYNATVPLRPVARQAMIAAMDVVGNPSSVHAEGRAAKALIERARGQIVCAVGAHEADVVFVSGATEAAALACAGRGLHGAAIEHDAVRAWVETDLAVDHNGQVVVDDPARYVLQAANSETGVLQNLPPGLAVSDWTQAFGKVPLAFDAAGVDIAFFSAHKIGGPKGIGALVIRRGLHINTQIKGGGQEMGRRAGTENLIGIAGFGAAAAECAQDVDKGAWGRVEKLRNILENIMDDSAAAPIFVGREAERLPNTSCIMTPGWKGETQVMQMDLAGFAVSAGAACSSGKVNAAKSSMVLHAMGIDAASASCAIRVSLGLHSTEAEIIAFAKTWGAAYDRFRRKAA